MAGNFQLSGDFSFNSHNIQSMDEFKFCFGIKFKELSKEQHVFIRSKVSEQLGLQAWEIPTPWGKGPVRYEEMMFETHPKDFERCKTMIKLLKEGGIELTANGYRYPPDTDHPLMETVNESADLRGRIKGFNGLNDFLEKVLAASQRNSVVAKKKTDRKPAGT